MPKEAKRKTKETKQKRKKGKFHLSAIFALLTRPDPNAPKRGLSAYMFFANDNRDKVREDNPGIKFGKLITHIADSSLTGAGDVGKILGEKWKELSDKDRKPYDEKARVDKERYENEKARYQAVRASLSPQLLSANSPSSKRLWSPSVVMVTMGDV
jgi:hypothetical protein